MDVKIKNKNGGKVGGGGVEKRVKGKACKNKNIKIIRVKWGVGGG